MSEKKCTSAILVVKHDDKLILLKISSVPTNQGEGMDLFGAFPSFNPFTSYLWFLVCNSFENIEFPLIFSLLKILSLPFRK